MCYSTSKEFNNEIKDRLRAGWTFIPKGRHKHAKVVAPNGFKTTVPGSPSDWRALRNFRRETSHLAARKGKGG